MISSTQSKIFDLQKRILDERANPSSASWESNIKRWETELAKLQIDLQQEQAIAQAKANASQPVATAPAMALQSSFSQPYSKPQYSIGSSMYFDALNQQRETQRREGLGQETYQSFLDRTGGAFSTAMGATAALGAMGQRRMLESETQRLATERQVAETQQLIDQSRQRRSQIAQRRGELGAQRESSLLDQQQAATLARQEADFRAKQRESDPYSQQTQRRILGMQAGLGMGGFGMQPFGSSGGIQPQSIAPQPSQSIATSGAMSAQEQLDEARAKSQLAFLPQFDALRNSIASRIARRMGTAIPQQQPARLATTQPQTSTTGNFASSISGIGGDLGFASQPRLSGFQNTPRLSGFQFGTSPLEPSRYFAGYIRQ